MKVRRRHLPAACAAFGALAPRLAASKFCGLHIVSVPDGAEVHVQGRYLGRTPVQYVHGREAQVRVRVTKPGYEAWEEDVDIPLDTIKAVSLTLTPKPRRQLGRRSSRGEAK